MQFRQREFVKEVPFRRFGESRGRDFVRVRNRDRCNRDPAQIPRSDRASTVADHLHLAVVVDLRDRRIRGRVFGPARNVLAVAVAEPGIDDELLAGRRFENQMLRQDFDPLNARIV